MTRSKSDTGCWSRMIGPAIFLIWDPRAHKIFLKKMDQVKLTMDTLKEAEVPAGCSATDFNALAESLI